MTDVPRKLSCRHIKPSGGIHDLCNVNNVGRRAYLRRIKREIQQGTYETPEKIDITVRRILKTLQD